jgi:hypothetical protein
MLKRIVPTLEYRRSSNSKRRRAQEIRRDYVVLLGRTYQWRVPVVVMKRSL